MNPIYTGKIFPKRTKVNIFRICDAQFYAVKNKIGQNRFFKFLNPLRMKISAKIFLSTKLFNWYCLSKHVKFLHKSSERNCTYNNETKMMIVSVTKSRQPLTMPPTTLSGKSTTNEKWKPFSLPIAIYDDRYILKER